MNDTLPDCIGYLGTPNKCEGCPVADICKRVIHKKRLEDVLAKIGEIKQALQG